jgi:cytochrome bd-type quinol oxidase subunit 2
LDKKLRSECIALVLLFAAFPLISAGAISDNRLVWWIGLASLVLGGVLPVWTRFMDHSHDTITDAGIEFDDRTS